MPRAAQLPLQRPSIRRGGTRNGSLDQQRRCRQGIEMPVRVVQKSTRHDERFESRRRVVARYVTTYRPKLLHPSCFSPPQI